MSLFEQVAQLFTRRQQKKLDDREALVNAILAGAKKAPSAESIASTLDEIGWTPEGLEKEVARRQARRELAAKMATVPDIQREEQQLGSQIAVMDEEFRPIREAYEKKRAAIFYDVVAVQARIGDAESCKAKLLASYQGPLLVELDELRAKRLDIERRIDTAEKDVGKYERNATFPDYEGMIGDVTREGWTTMAASSRQVAAELKKQLPALNKREEEILEAMLLP